MGRARAVVLAGALLTLSAFVFDAAPLFVPGAGFILLGVLTPAWVWLAVRRGTVSRRVAAEEIVEHQAVEAILAVRRGRLGLPGAEIQEPMAHGPVRISAPPALLHGARSTDIRMMARFERRGRHQLPPPVLRVRDPLGLADIARPGHGPVLELLVLPRTEPVGWRVDPRGRRLVGPDLGHAEEPLAAVDVDGLRPYRIGTSASRIHWPALAKGQGLLERQLRADGEARPLIVLDARASVEPIGREHGPALLDAAIRAAASLTLDLAMRGGCRLLLPGDTRPVVVEPDLRGWPALHVRLALLDGTHAAAPALAAVAGTAPVFYVSLSAPDRLPAALAAARGAKRVLVAPSELCGEAPPSFTVSGCRGYLVGAGAGRGRRPTLSGSAAG